MSALPVPDTAVLSPAEAPAALRSCQHCGQRFRPRYAEEQFCCSGCRSVHDLIQEGGFGTFYELLGRGLLQPVGESELDPDHLEELGEAIADAERLATASHRPAQLSFRLGNLSCTACLWLVDHLLRRHPGALRMNGDTSRSLLTLWWTPGEFEALAFLRELHRHGYPPSLCRPEDEEAPQESRALLTRLGVTAGLAMNTMAFTLPSYLGLDPGHELNRLFLLVAFASATLALAIGGAYFFQRALSSLRVRALHMDVPISLGLIAAWLGSTAGLVFGIDTLLYFDFVAIFAFLMLAGRYLHLRLLDRNRRQLHAREREITTAWRLRADGARERIVLARIASGDSLEIASGGMVPVEAELASPAASLLLDWITGEPEAVPFLRGQRIPAGARNGSSAPVQIIARQAYSGSFLERLFAPADDAFEDHSAAVSTHPVRKYYLVSVLCLAFVGAGAWLWAGQGVAAALQVLISILVVSCPCALGLALPLLDEILLAKLKRDGLFIRRHSLWPRLRQIRCLAFDKTGTLTEPVRRLRNPEALEALDEAALQALRHLVAQNPHPVGRALRDVLVGRFGPLPAEPDAAFSPIREHPGQGVSFREGHLLWKLGRGDWACPDLQGAATKACVLSCEGQALACFHFAEAIRDGAVEQMRALRAQGYRIRLLSGDPDIDRVSDTAGKLGLAPEEVHAGLSPEEKAELLAATAPAETLFVGDGGNDGPAFEVAGATGSPATGIRAIETRADFVFTGRGFHAIALLLRAAHRRRLMVGTLFAVALTYNLAAVSLCLAGWMTPLLAAILMPLSSLLSTAIASRV